MFKSHLTGLALLMLLILCAPLCAQRLPLRAGDVVRISAPSCGMNRHTTALEAQRNDSLVFDLGPCPMTDIASLEVHRGKKRHWLVGAGVGLLAGAGAGAALFASSGGVEGCTGACWAAVGAIYGAGPGVLLGAGIGALIRSDRWAEVPVDRLSVRFSPRPAGRLGLGIAMAF